jgi:site-specific recombinase XerC
MTKLGRFLAEVTADGAKRQDIERFLLQFANPSNRHAYYRAINTFYNWREQNFGLPSPMKHMKAPRLGKLIMPSLTQEQVLTLLEQAQSVRDKSIIALFTESGLRLSELTQIKLQDFDWDNHIVRVIGKGRKEGFAPFGELSARYLREWLALYEPNGNIWGMNQMGNHFHATKA